MAGAGGGGGAGGGRGGGGGGGGGAPPPYPPPQAGEGKSKYPPPLAGEGREGGGGETACRDDSWRAPRCGGQCLLDRGGGEPFVLARHRIAALRHETPMLEEAERGVAHVGRELGRAARLREFFERLAKLRADPLPGHGRMDVEHVDRIDALERRKADRCAINSGDQGQFAGQPCPQC